MRQNPFITLLFCLLLVAGAAVLLAIPASADPSAGPGGKPFVTIVAQGSQAYYLGEKVTLRGQNTDSDTTYLFLTGPNVPAGGAKLTSPRQAVVSGSPDSFTVVKTNADKSWEYPFYTADLPLDAGSYTLYAVSRPVAQNQFGDSATYGTVSVIIKRPFITANLSSPFVAQGQPLAVTGTAEGIPPDVQIWILGPNFYTKAIESVNSDATFKYEVRQEVTRNLNSGQYFIVVQHPMQNNRFDIDVSGDYVRSVQGNGGTNLFRIAGPGSLQGGDAADALAAAISERETHDETGTNDTYTILPFQVTDMSGGTEITIAADGTQSYYLGENVIFRGRNAGSDTTYLFLTGPNLPAAGAKLTSPREPVVSGKADSFTSVKTRPDKTWEYSWYTANLPLDAGTYSVYAGSRPEAKDQPGSGTAGVGIIVKKPFIAAAISPATITSGQPFTINGTAEGDPPAVQVWIFGTNYVFTAKPPVGPDASFTFTGDAAMSGKLPAGQDWLIVQHPMQNNQFDIDVSGDYVRNQNLNNGTNLFRISGPGSLQGSDAADALVAAFSDPEILNEDTYTVIPFQVTGTASPAVPAGSSSPVPGAARSIPLEYAAPIGVGAIVVLGIVLWKRQ